jgi:hypothetical protein
MSMDSHGGIILAGETEEHGETLVPVPRCPPHPTRTDPGANTGLRSERQATNRLIHGTAFMKNES